jgi:hypothetical protein
MMVANLPRSHWETVSPLAFAAVSIAESSSGVTRTRSIPALAFPFGSGGRPGLLGFFCCFKASELLNDCRSDGIRR